MKKDVLMLVMRLVLATMCVGCTGDTAGDASGNSGAQEETVKVEDFVGEPVEIRVKGEKIGISVMCKDGLYGYQDAAGNIIVEPKYSFAHDFCNCSGRYFTNTVVQNYLPDVDLGGVYGIAVVEKVVDGKTYYGLINHEGVELIEPKYMISLLGFYEHDVVPIRFSENGETLYKYIDIFGDNAAYRDLIYTSVYFRSEYLYASEFDDNGIAIVSWYDWEETSWNIIDEIGRPKFYSNADKITKYDDNYYLVEYQGKYGLINANGNVVAEVKYDSPESIVIE